MGFFNQLGEFICNTTKYVIGENKLSEEVRDIRCLLGRLNNGDKITRRAKVEDLFSAKDYWFEPPLEFNEGVPMFECDQYGAFEFYTTITENALISKNRRPNTEQKIKRTISSQITNDGKNFKKGILAIFFIIRFLASFPGRKLNLVEDYEQMSKYVTKVQRCVCKFCVANIDHQIP